ncbi:hypothetical protein [Nonomuraea angiospora]|uniref:hypothetical protein n=1 Tax=Nonomuraea angiospora TaxID=46172 RepID=UPI0029A8D4D8|nr:hypothetical protein [Nonomuraea angiospora]MDX3110343.1 hypothetical protein [Nonomuraea angiospora]
MTHPDLKTPYERDGYLVLDRALGPGEVGELLEQAVRICRGELGDISGACWCRRSWPTRRRRGARPLSCRHR